MKPARIAVVLVAAVAVVASFRDIPRHPFASDEGMWIHIAQKVWGLVAAGDWDSPEWENFDATWGYVNPPVGKYLMGLSLAVEGEHWTWKSGEKPPDRVLAAARRPSAVLGVLGVLGLLWIGSRALSFRAAVCAALALAISPLWITVSRRAMTDVYGAGLGILAICAFVPVLDELHGRRRGKVLAPWIVASGVLCGLAVGAKLNAAATPVLLGCVLLLLTFRELSGPRKLRGAAPVILLGIVFAVSSVATFVGSNPYLQEDTWNRFRGMVAFWQDMSEQRAVATRAGGFGNAFFPEEKGLRILSGKILSPSRPIGLLLLVPLAVAFLSKLTWARSVPARARLLGWVLLVPAAMVAGGGKNQLLHAWIPWVGLLGAVIAIAVSTRRELAARARRGGELLTSVWFVVVAVLLWKNTYLPQERYYLPLLPVACLGAGYGLAVLRGDVAAGAGRSWPRLLVDLAIGAGVLSVLATFPEYEHAELKRIASEAPAAARVLQWLSVAPLTAAAAAGLFSGRTAKRARSVADPSSS